MAFSKIKLTQNKESLVDSEDFENLNKYKWYAQWNPATQKYYATRSDYSSGKQKVIIMSRFLMNFPEGKEVDHINGNSLDNRKQNLRIVSKTENQRNRRLNSNNFSGVVGVHFAKSENRWVAQGYVSGKRTRLKASLDFFEAVCARKSFEAAQNFHQNHGRL